MYTHYLCVLVNSEGPHKQIEQAESTGSLPFLLWYVDLNPKCQESATGHKLKGAPIQSLVWPRGVKGNSNTQRVRITMSFVFFLPFFFALILKLSHHGSFSWQQ